MYKINTTNLQEGLPCFEYVEGEHSGNVPVPVEGTETFSMDTSTLLMDTTKALERTDSLVADKC